MTKYSVSRLIQSSPESIWALLTNSASYDDWNPAVLEIEGTIAEGEHIRLRSIVNPDRQFKLRVSDVTPNRSMAWSDGMPFGLFKGIRSFRLSPHRDATEFLMEEVHTGLLEPLISKTIPDMTDSFNQFADGLKSAAESRDG